jgi:hypothetical protein
MDAFRLLTELDATRAAIARARHAGEVAERERLEPLILRAALDGCAAIGYGSDEANLDVATDIMDRLLSAAAIRSLAPDTEGKP